MRGRRKRGVDPALGAYEGKVQGSGDAVMDFFVDGRGDPGAGLPKLMSSKDFDTLYAAGSARAIGDWLLGMNATRAYTLRYGNGKNVLSIGRVQTPTLALIVDRQKAIEQFKPETYWEVRTDYRGGWFSYTKGRFTVKEEAEAFMQEILPLELEIKSVERKRPWNTRRNCSI